MTKGQKDHHARIRDFGCIACFLMSGVPGTPCCIHHLREGQGMSQKASNWLVIGLCEPGHHNYKDHSRPEKASFHMERERFIAEFGTELELMEVQNGIIYKRGLQRCPPVEIAREKEDLLRRRQERSYV